MPRFQSQGIDSLSHTSVTIWWISLSSRAPPFLTSSAAIPSVPGALLFFSRRIAFRVSSMLGGSGKKALREYKKITNINYQYIQHLDCNWNIHIKQVLWRWSIVLHSKTYLDSTRLRILACFFHPKKTDAFLSNLYCDILYYGPKFPPQNERGREKKSTTIVQIYLYLIPCIYL